MHHNYQYGFNNTVFNERRQKTIKWQQKKRSKTNQRITSTSEEREARWQALTLADDFLFSKIMADPELCRELIHRIFPNLEITELSPVQVQKTVKLALHLRGVRFDVFTVMARSIFDLEMQKEKLKDLFRRTHAYHIVCGHDALNIADLKKSGSYENLPDVYVVFICLFDPFSDYDGCGRHMYPFKMLCTEEPNIALNDGIHTVFLNAKGTKDDVSPELKRFLDFVAMNKIITEKGEDADPFINVLDQRVKEAKENIKWRLEFMKLLTVENEIRAKVREQERAEGRNEGIAIGDKQGSERTQRTIYERLITSGNMTPQQASIITGWNG